MAFGVSQQQQKARDEEVRTRKCYTKVLQMPSVIHIVGDRIYQQRISNLFQDSAVAARWVSEHHSNE